MAGAGSRGGFYSSWSKEIGPTLTADEVVDGEGFEGRGRQCNWVTAPPPAAARESCCNGDVELRREVDVVSTRIDAKDSMFSYLLTV